MDKRTSESENVELPEQVGQQQKEVKSGDFNIDMNLDAIKDIKKEYKKLKDT